MHNYGWSKFNTFKSNTISREYLNLIQSEGRSQLIFAATHITELSQSCIDHILTNSLTSCSSGSLAVEIADNLPVFTIFYDPNFSSFPDIIEFRDFCHFDREKFRTDLEKENWDSTLTCCKVHESLTRLLHIFTRVSNNHAPLETAKIWHSYKLWITSGLKKSMKMWDKFYKKWLTTHETDFLNRHKIYRDKIASINKRDSFYNEMLTYSNNTKKMWDNINLLINKKQPNSQIEKIEIDDKQYQQHTSISNCLNNFFHSGITIAQIR